MTQQPVAVWGRWLVLYMLVTLGFASLSELPALRVAHGVLAYLLLIVGASREGGRWLTGVMLLLGYLAVDWLFLPPRNSFGGASQRDFIILIGFAITAGVVSQLVLSLRASVEVATARARELERLGRERLVLEREALRVKALERGERLKQTLIQSIAHDLRTPIATMTMLTDPSSCVPPQLTLDRIRTEVQRLDAFVATLGGFTTISGQDALLVVEPHVVDDLIGAAVTSMESGLANHVLRVVRQDDGGCQLVSCDFTISLQILRNLLQNAARYSPAGSPIDIMLVATENHTVVITIADRGPGLAEADDVEQIFEPLRRGNAAQQADGGAGLGLAIARTFAQAQAGNVTYSPRAGGGACFHLSLPAATVLPGDITPDEQLRPSVRRA